MWTRFDHDPRNGIPRPSIPTERKPCVRTKALANVLAAAGKRAEHAVAEDDACGQGGPDTGGAVRASGEAHPEEGDGDDRGGDEGVPEAGFGPEVADSGAVEVGAQTEVDEGDGGGGE